MATRLERVIIDIDDRGTRPMATLAGKTRLAARELDKADRSVVSFNKSTTDASRGIDKLSDRVGLAIDVLATLGPALVPIGTAAVPAVAGLANQLGFAAIAGGTAILAFQGVGDALKAVNEAQLEPTAANLDKAREAMAKLGPAGRDFVMTLQELRPQLQGLQDAAQAGLFPGLTEGIESLMGRFPEVERIIGQTAEAMGELAEQGGEALAGPEWDDFFAMLETQAKPTLIELGQTIGNFSKGLAELWMAFMPLSRDFSGGLLEMSRSFADWADGLSSSAGFAEFVDYIRDTGPQVLDTLGALTMALVDISKAAAPLGGPALQVIEAFAKALSAVASSDIGTPLLTAIAAMRAYSLATTVASKASGGFVRTQASFVGGLERQKSALSGLRADWAAYGAVTRTAQGRAQASAAQMIAHREAAERLKGSLATVGGAAAKSGALVGALALQSTGAADKIGLTNTTSLALAGTLAGPYGAGIGAAVGATLDLRAANEGLRESIAKVNLAAGGTDLGAMSAAYDELAKKRAELMKPLSDPGGTGFEVSIQRARLLMSVLDGTARAAEQAQARIQGALSGGGAFNAGMTAGGFDTVKAAADRAKASTDAFKRSLIDANNALTRVGAIDAYRSSLMNFTDSLAQNGRTLAVNTRAGLANRAALRDIAANAMQAADGMKNMDRRANFLSRARKGFIDAAVAAGATRREARQLADMFGLLDRTKANPKVEERGADASRKRVQNMRAEIARLRGKMVNMDERGAAAARARIAYLRGEINRLTGKTVTVTTNYVQRYTTLRTTTFSAGGMQARAEGGTVLGQRYPYGDKVLTMLAPGEEVITNRNGEADRFRRDRKAGRIPAYADGGTVQHLAKGGTARRRPLTKRQQRRVKARRASISRQLNRWEDALDRSRAAIKRETDVRDDLSQKREALSSSVRDQFRSDIFAQSNVWAAGGGTGGAIGVLQSDIAKINTFYTQLSQLSKRGVKGDALAAIAATGDVGKAGGFLSMDDATLSQYQSLYTQRQQASQNVGGWAGHYAYGAEQAVVNKNIAAQTKAVRVQTAAIKRLEKAYRTAPQQIGRQINSAAAKGKKKER